MKSSFAVLALLLGLAACDRQPPPDASLHEQPGARIRQAYLAAYNSKDADAVAALYSDDASLVSDGGTFRGRAEIRQWVQAAIEQGSRLESIEPSAGKNSGTLAYVSARSKRLVGAEVHRGLHLIVLEEIAGQWKITQHFSMTVK